MEKLEEIVKDILKFDVPNHEIGGGNNLHVKTVQVTAGHLVTSNGNSNMCIPYPREIKTTGVLPTPTLTVTLTPEQTKIPQSLLDTWKRITLSGQKVDSSLIQSSQTKRHSNT